MVETSGANKSPECNICQKQSMDHVNEVYHIFQLIYQRIFVYLRDVQNFVLQESPEEQIFHMKNEDTLEFQSGIQAWLISRQTIADCVAFFVICTFFGIFVVFSSRQNRVPEPCINLSRPLAHGFNARIVDLVEEDEHDQDSVFELPNPVHPWGDSIAEPERVLPQRIYLHQPKPRPYCCSIETSSRQSSASIKTTHSHQFQTTRAKDQIHYKNLNNSGWLIRRTRSGQIYGKYPIS